MKNIALIIAGGKGVRMGHAIPKQFIHVKGKPVIIYTLEVFQKHPSIDEIMVVCIQGWEDILADYAKTYGITKLKMIVKGGSVGQESIFNGIKELKKTSSNDDIVLIHDAIRPMVSEEIISDCIAVTKEKGNAIAVIPCMEAMLIRDTDVSAKKAYPRSELKRTQTPQGFKLGEILEAHEKARELGIIDSIASCTLMVEIGKSVYFSSGSELNIKLTTPEDIDLFKIHLSKSNSEKNE